MSEDQAVPTTHKRWVAQISFYAPDAGPINIIAATEEEARALIPTLLPNFKDIQVLSIVEFSKIDWSGPGGGSVPTQAPTSEAVH